MRKGSNYLRYTCNNLVFFFLFTVYLIFLEYKCLIITTQKDSNKILFASYIILNIRLIKTIKANYGYHLQHLIISQCKDM